MSKWDATQADESRGWPSNPDPLLADPWGDFPQARAEHDAQGPEHRAWCAGPSAHISYHDGPAEPTGVTEGNPPQYLDACARYGRTAADRMYPEI
jgi:hypothetical protein